MNSFTISALKDVLTNYDRLVLVKGCKPLSHIFWSPILLNTTLEQPESASTDVLHPLTKSSVATIGKYPVGGSVV